MRCTTPTCCTGNCRQGRDCPHRGHGVGNIAIQVILLICFAGLLAMVGPTLDDHSAEAAQADAIAAAQARERFITAAQRQCGINAAVVEQADGSMRCALHNGRKTERVAMVQP